jgi:uncharacterized delta-60 repeat protein
LAMLPAQAGATSSAGILDPSFGSGGYSTQPWGGWVGAAAAAVQPDGKIVTVGEGAANGSNVNTGTNEIVSSRVNSDGTLDTSYGTGGWVHIPIGGGAGGNALALQSDGKIVLAGVGTVAGSPAFAAVRLLPNGALDPSFGSGGIATEQFTPPQHLSIQGVYTGYNNGIGSMAESVVIEPDGKIALGGVAKNDQNEFAITRLNPDGSPDTSFGQHGWTTFNEQSCGWGLALQPNGKLVLAGQGYPNGAAGQEEYMAARVLANGAPDTTFGHDGIVNIPIGGMAYGDAIAAQRDGRLIVAGSAYTGTPYASGVVAAAARLNVDGTLDRTYGNGGIATLPDSMGVNAAVVDSKGRVVLGAVGASAVRFTPTGSPDQTFGNGGLFKYAIGWGDAANGIVVQRDGRIVLSGVTTVPNASGRTVQYLIRLTG